MNVEAAAIVEGAKAVWYNQPIVVALVGGSVVAVISLIANKYAWRPKYCAVQVEACKTFIQEEVDHAKLGLEKEIGKVDESFREHKKVSHDVFARKDVIEPQIKATDRNLAYIRRRLDQLANDRGLPRVEDHEEG